MQLCLFFQVGEVVTTIPTIGFNVEQVTYKNLKFQVWDLGGQTSIRPYWRCYYSNTDAVIYVVDSADRDRVGISKQVITQRCTVIKPYPNKFFMSFYRSWSPCWRRRNSRAPSSSSSQTSRTLRAP